MNTYLVELGYRVSRAHSGNSAYRLFLKDPADIVITDVRMPDGDGETLIKKLRIVAPGLPIIVVTGHIGTTESMEEEAETKRLAVLKKPLSLAAMAETVERLLQSH
jgi:DNA-binding NtrC family response regulator